MGLVPEVQKETRVSFRETRDATTMMHAVSDCLEQLVVIRQVDQYTLVVVGPFGDAVRALMKEAGATNLD